MFLFFAQIVGGTSSGSKNLTNESLDIDVIDELCFRVPIVIWVNHNAMKLFTSDANFRFGVIGIKQTA